MARSCSLLRVGWLLRVLASQLPLSWWLLFTSFFVSLGLRHKVILLTKLNTNGVLFIPDSFSSQTFRHKINLQRKGNDLHAKLRIGYDEHYYCARAQMQTSPSLLTAMMNVKELPSVHNTTRETITFQNIYLLFI